MSKDDDRLPAGLAQSTPETLAKALEDVLGPEFPRTIADRAVARIETTTSLWAGPVPDPRTLEEFEQILPGSADRLVVMAEIDRRRLLRLMARLAEKSYRRGYQHGGLPTRTMDPVSTPLTDARSAPPASPR